MSHDRKHDHEQIIAKLDKLAQIYRSESRYWWPEFLFHYTALQNVVSVLGNGMLYSRNEAIRRGLLKLDGASQSVLSRTSGTVKDCVRLYFRPKTPTQFSNEGIRPQEKRVHGSHCPIPVMLLFDSRDVLTRKGTEFSSGSLAGCMPGQRGSRASFFEKLPFGDIYHNSWIDPSSRNKIVARRHAEVIVQTGLDLDALRCIWCRSEAEKETLISFLSKAQLDRWSNKIFHGNKYDLFFSKWSYIDRVILGRSTVQFYFNRNTGTPDIFDLHARLKDYDTGQKLKAHEGRFRIENKILLNFDKSIDNYTIKLYMDDCLAYRSDYNEIDDLF